MALLPSGTKTCRHHTLIFNLCSTGLADSSRWLGIDKVDSKAKAYEDSFTTLEQVGFWLVDLQIKTMEYAMIELEQQLQRAQLGGGRKFVHC